MRVFDIDQRPAAEVDTQRYAMPKRHGKQSSHAEDEREGQEVPLLPEEIDICISKKFHMSEVSRFQRFKVSESKQSRPVILETLKP